MLVGGGEIPPEYKEFDRIRRYVKRVIRKKGIEGLI